MTLIKDLGEKSDLLAKAFAMKKPGIPKVQDMMQESMELVGEAIKQMQLLNKFK